MARRMITEEDLLNFRARADELAKQLEVKYEEIERSKKTQLELEERDTGLLILGGGDVDIAILRKLSTAAWNEGFSPEVVDISETFADHNPRERIPMWQKALDKAQFGYLKLSERVKRIVILGTGRSAAAATVMTEQYPVDGLIIVGKPQLDGAEVDSFNDHRIAMSAAVASVACKSALTVNGAECASKSYPDFWSDIYEKLNVKTVK